MNKIFLLTLIASIFFGKNTNAQDILRLDVGFEKNGLSFNSDIMQQYKQNRLYHICARF